MNQHVIGTRIDRLLGNLWDAQGTDLLLTAGMPPQMRVDGDLSPVAGHQALTADDTDALLGELLTDDQTVAVARPARVRLLLQLARRRPDPRQRVHPARRHRGRAAHDPARDPVDGAARPAAGRRPTSPASTRAWSW